MQTRARTYASCWDGGFADALTDDTTWRQQLRDADANGIASRRAYLGSQIRRETHSGKTQGQFKPRPRVPGAGDSYAWCCSIAGAMNRAHKYTCTPASGCKRCPRYQDDQDWLDAKTTKRHEFFVPALSAGTPRVQVSRKFWCRLFDVQDAALQTLQW